jgi:predicted transcriptional regulator
MPLNYFKRKCLSNYFCNLLCEDMTAIPLRKLKAKAVMKDLSLQRIAELSGVPYSEASRVLNGRLINPEYLSRIEKAINTAPHPK